MRTLLTAILIALIFPVGIKLASIIFWGELFRQLSERMTNLTIEEVDDAFQEPTDKRTIGPNSKQ